MCLCVYSCVCVVCLNVCICVRVFCVLVAPLSTCVLCVFFFFSHLCFSAVTSGNSCGSAQLHQLLFRCRRQGSRNYFSRSHSIVHSHSHSPSFTHLTLSHPRLPNHSHSLTRSITLTHSLPTYPHSPPRSPSLTLTHALAITHTHALRTGRRGCGGSVRSGRIGARG